MKILSRSFKHTWAAQSRLVYMILTNKVMPSGVVSFYWLILSEWFLVSQFSDSRENAV